jgi:hypothetical protein
MPIFKRKHLSKILTGEKTQTRRTHKLEWKIGRTYSVRDRWFEKPKGHIRITRKFKQKLGEITLLDIRKEGFATMEDFKRGWEEIYGSGSWNPEQVVTVYEFILSNPVEEGMDKRP